MKDEKVNEIVFSIRMKQKTIENINAEIDELKGELKEELLNRGVDVIDTGIAKVSWKEESRMNFDSKKFKKEHADLYESYTTEKVVKKFLVK